MRIFFYFLLFFLMISIVSAIGYDITSINDCAGPLTITVTGEYPIDPFEYNINDCSSNDINVWHCVCNDKMILSMNVSENTLNKYYFRIDYLAYYYINGGGGGGGGIGNYTPIQVNKTTIIIENITPIKPIEPVAPTEPIITPIPNEIPPTLTNNTAITTPPSTNFFIMIWEWIKKILLFKLW